MHPKTEIKPDHAAIERILRMGWAGQLKIHGHRAQIHFSSAPGEAPIAYTRHGTLHKKLIPVTVLQELVRIFRPKEGWTALDAEWLKPENRLYVFDYLKKDGEELGHLTYAQRHALLPRDFLSPHIVVLPILKSFSDCWEVLQKEDEGIEGLVFKSLDTPGFSDTSIVRCRKKSVLERYM